MSVSFLIKLQLLDLQIIKKGPLHRFFPVDFATFLRKPFSFPMPTSEQRNQL